jgi:beta-glucosidase
VASLIVKSQKARRKGFSYDRDAHHAVARSAAAQSAVLMKNDGGLLPLSPPKNGLCKSPSLAVIGAFAKKPRYQGAGSSRINPHRVDSPWDALVGLGYNAEYAEGYTLAPESNNIFLKGGADLEGNEEMIQAAAKLAATKDAAVVFAGLPDEIESEGFDRTVMDMPKSHNRLIEAVAAANPNTVVVLMLGSPVAMPWFGSVKSVVCAYLGGQAVGSAIADVLSGAVNPSGKLAETWPLTLADTPCYNYYPSADVKTGLTSVEYRESIFAGYRYYETAGKPVALPFGWGLSYTSFHYKDLVLDRPDFARGGLLRATFTVENTGVTAGAETAMLFVAGPAGGTVMRPALELKAFDKVFLEAGQSKSITLVLRDRDFAYWNEPAKAWSIEAGEYSICVGPNVQNLPLRAKVSVAGDGREATLAALRAACPEYFALGSVTGSLAVSDASFTALYGGALPPSAPTPGAPVTMDSSIADLLATPAGKAFMADMQSKMDAGGLADQMASMMYEMPVRCIMMFSGGHITGEMLEGLVAEANK